MHPARPWRRPLALAMMAAALASACATGDGEPDDPDVKLIPLDELQPGEDTPAAQDAGVETDVPAEDVPVEPMDVGFDVGRDTGTDVGFDVGRDVGTDVGTDVGCVGPTSQACGTCGTQTRTCAAGAWTAWTACVEPTFDLALSWRVTLTPGATPSLVWFSGGASALTGGAVDAFGYADLSNVTVNPCTRAVAFTKRYVVGRSTGATFSYAGSSTAATAFNGAWVDTSAPTNRGTYTAQARSGLTAGAFGGGWRVAVTWTVNSTTLAVGATGGLSGTMVDVYGTAALRGAVDLNSGAVMFIKRYTSGTSIDQVFLYTGTFDAAGTRVMAGAWSDQGDSGLTGSWTAAR